MSKDLGQKGEEIACRWLASQGYKIRHANWRFGHKELDIVAVKDNVLHIVEVKTRMEGHIDEPADAVGRSKQKNIVDAAEAYIYAYELELEICFDIIFITMSGTAPENIDYIEDAFTPYG
ncbi:MAG: YraN family protein [Prevotellaceae bacterium]|jgi:putative endonuclease|nr:YraN family protein [Prevotellaceae bacterium]